MYFTKSEQCDDCGFERPAYNSCGNRHCPKCQALAKAKWLEARTAELLPVSYFHNVFTLPHELNPLALCNKDVVFELLFQSVAQTLQEFGHNNLGGKMGFTTILHTWDQTLGPHLHVHCIIPGGVLAPDRTRWISSRESFLFHVEALSIVFRRKLTALLEDAFNGGDLMFPGHAAPLESPRNFSLLLAQLRGKPWVVYSKEPFAGPEQVLNYLARYTHRIAISNDRILSVEDREVSFRYRDREHGNQLKTRTLEAQEFIRRFLLHVLHEGFMRIRHYGFLANRCKNVELPRCRELLGLAPELTKPPAKTVREWMLELTGEDVTRCPRCHRGTMIRIALINRPKFRLAPKTRREPLRLDSS